MGRTAEELVKDIERKDLETLCLYLLYKREVDGLNGRIWDAGFHMGWEDHVRIKLRKFNYLGDTGD